MCKRAFALLLALAMLVSPLAGVPVTAQTPAPPSGEPILIGLQGPMTGDYAYEGQGFKKAVELLVKQTNEAGGLLGRPVELVIEDDKGDPKEASLVADRLVSAGVVAVIGGYNSTATEASSRRCLPSTL
mgnify:CR=1 FL=1